MKNHTFFSPGRVNIIGEHIDYNGGFVLPIAIAQGITAQVTYTQNSFISISSAQFGVAQVFDLQHTATAKPTKTWADYPLGVIQFLQKQGTPVAACNIEMSSTLPDGSGLSSSAALEVLIAFILQYPQQPQPNLTQLALLCQAVENQFVGVNCGIMDQFAVANGRKNQAMCLNCDTLENQYIPFNLGAYSLVIINSKQARTLAGSAYNERRAQCEQALKIIAQHRNITHLCNAQMQDLAFISDAVVQQRAKHVISEQQRVLQSIEALKNGDIPTLGKLMTASHTSLNLDYEVSSEALNLIVESSLAFEHCLGARLTGAGFGGCCIALVQTQAIEAYQAQVAKQYFEQWKIYPDFYITQAQEGVRLLN